MRQLRHRLHGKKPPLAASSQGKPPLGQPRQHKHRSQQQRAAALSSNSTQPVVLGQPCQLPQPPPSGWSARCSPAVGSPNWTGRPLRRHHPAHRRRLPQRHRRSHRHRLHLHLHRRHHLYHRHHLHHRHRRHHRRCHQPGSPADCVKKLIMEGNFFSVLSAIAIGTTDHTETALTVKSCTRSSWKISPNYNYCMFLCVVFLSIFPPFFFTLIR